MPKYRVHFEAVADLRLTVEAANEEDAIETAFDNLPGDICAHCTGWGKKWSREIGEWDIANEETDVVKISD
jgi:kynurenine formamidase